MTNTPVQRTADQNKRFMEHELMPVWIRGVIPDFGNATVMVTTHNTEALLWRSQGHPVTQTFMVVNHLVTV